jgi:hypothetical protein
MAYTPVPTDATQPVDTIDASTAAAEFRALKAYIAGLVLPATASAGPRQCIVDALKNAAGVNNALSAGAGLRVSLSATATPFQMTHANGFVGGRASNSEESIALDNADILGADLPLSNTAFLYRNFGSGYGRTLVPPQYGYAFDQTKQALLNFEGANGAVATADDFGNTWALTGATISTAQFKFGASSLRCAGAQYARNSSITILGDGSWEISCWFRVDAITAAIQQIVTGGNATGFGFNLALAATTGKLAIYLSSNGTAWDIANAGAGAATILAATWYKARLVFDALAGTYRVYLSNNGAAETQDFTVSSTAKICGITTMTIGAAFDNTLSFAGYIDAFRFLPAATNTTTETPAAVAPAIGDQMVNWFDIPSMKMWEATGASAVAGTNPTFTVRSRVFIGEADTSGVAVTAVRNYALKGQYIGPDTAIPAAGTRTSFNHNIGTYNVKVAGWGRNLTAANGIVPGNIVPLDADVTAALLPFSPAQITGRNTAVLQGGDQVGVFLYVTSAGVAGGMNAGTWRMFLTAERSF